jgi:predicted glycoside hydrolase/deacetylase ChbG (UPF0249 family)
LFVYTQAAQLLDRLHIDDVVREFRAQLYAVLATGLRPAHLDFHSLADGGRDDVLDVALMLADQHDLAVRVWLDRGLRIARRNGRPVVDHPFLDSFQLDIDAKADRYAALLRALPVGLTEWAVHPATADDPPARGPSGWPVRSSDHRFRVSAQARELIEAEGIVLIDYRPIQQMWISAAG